MIRIRPRDLDRIAADAEAAYPAEGCGFLMGRMPASAPEEPREIASVLPAANARETERGRRYLIAPHEVRETEERATAEGLVIVGFFHSHPDHPAVPSEFDREHAWPWYTYLIVPVANGKAGRPRAWRLREDREAFDEEKVTIMEEGAS